MPHTALSLPRRIGRRALVALTAATLLAGTAAFAAPPINTLKGGLFGGRGDTAILGYDPVAYFTDGKPVKGLDSFATEWMGARWKFASQAHLDQFKASPEKYAPQYGGYCAYGVSQDHLVNIEPDKFKIIDGKLYLNYDAGVQQTWIKDPAGYNKLADAKFPALLKQ
ncbi:MAG TPA: YHS domain-containing (seleno)protein [Ideonella sp.]|nr:YHS domain-containing (seleno)protein [Ideonella sp.]